MFYSKKAMNSEQFIDVFNIKKSGSILVLKSLKTSNNMAEIEEYEYEIQ